MNKLWNTSNYSAKELQRTAESYGLRVNIHPRVHPFIRREVLLFCKWLRVSYPFPIKVHIHILNAKKVLARTGEKCYGICFIPDDPNDSITIYVAGGYKETGILQDLQDYTWTTIGTLAHELSHYYQYINRIELTDKGKEWQATYYAHKVQK